MLILFIGCCEIDRAGISTAVEAHHVGEVEYVGLSMSGDVGGGEILLDVRVLVLEASDEERVVG